MNNKEEIVTKEAVMLLANDGAPAASSLSHSYNRRWVEISGHTLEVAARSVIVTEDGSLRIRAQLYKEFVHGHRLFFLDGPVPLLLLPDNGGWRTFGQDVLEVLTITRANKSRKELQLALVNGLKHWVITSMVATKVGELP